MDYANLRVSRYGWRWLALVGLVCLVSAGTVWACSTPVYRYAMYRWEPAPYEIYYFHEGAIAEDVAQWHQEMQAAARCDERTANLFLVAVDVKADPELKTIPPDVRKWWLAQQQLETPCYAVVTPFGLPLHQGDLDKETFQRLIDSPARQAVVEKLAEGRAGVMVMLSGSDEAANAEAAKLIQDFVGDIASGKIELYVPPPMGFYTPRGSEQQEEPERPKVEVGFVKVDRSDPVEKWFVEALLSMEQDLKDEQFADKPMMFVVFGRGRALPPCIGKGINRDNLLDCIDFVMGPCSCTVKDQNPGMDLLFATNWFVAADKMAAKFGAEEGNEHQLSTEDFFPDLMIPPVQQAVATAEVPAASAEEPDVERAEEPAALEAPETPAASTDADAEQVSSEPADQHDADVGVEIASVSLPSASTGADSSPAGQADPGMFRGVFLVGAGVAVAFVLLFGMTFMVLRPR
jgi:hypothetical protein